MKEKLFVEQAIKRVELERFLKRQLEDAGFTKSDIVKTPLVTRIVVNVTRPGLAIGKSGQNIKSLTDAIQKNYGIENPQLEIREITNPNLDAAAVANKLKALIERGYSWRSVAYKTLKDIMGAGAQGVEITVSGKLQGKGGRKKQQRIAAGYMKKAGDQTRLVDYAKTAAYPKQGAIGIKTRIVKPETQFVDKVDIMQFLEQKRKSAEPPQKSEEAPAQENAEKASEPAVVEAAKEVGIETNVAEKEIKAEAVAKQPNEAAVKQPKEHKEKEGQKVKKAAHGAAVKEKKENAHSAPKESKEKSDEK